MLLFGELPDEKVSEAFWRSKYWTYCRYIICSTISAWYMSAWDRMFDSYSNLAPQNRHLNFISLKFWIQWGFPKISNYLVDQMNCLKQNLRVLLDVSLYNGPAAWPMCNTSVQLLYKVLHKLYNFSIMLSYSSIDICRYGCFLVSKR